MPLPKKMPKIKDTKKKETNKESIKNDESKLKTFLPKSEYSDEGDPILTMPWINDTNLGLSIEKELRKDNELSKARQDKRKKNLDKYES